jgi:ATP-binding cassette subfamily F protein uup
VTDAADALATEERKAAKAAEGKSSKNQANSKGTKGSKNNYSERLSFKEQYEYDHLEGEIEVLDSKREVMETELSAHAMDHDKVMELSKKLGAIVSEIDEKTGRWIELSERA